MSESDRSKRRHDDEIKSRIEWVSIGPLSLPLLRVCVLNIAIAIIFVLSTLCVSVAPKGDITMILPLF